MDITALDARDFQIELEHNEDSHTVDITIFRDVDNTRDSDQEYMIAPGVWQKAMGDGPMTIARIPCMAWNVIYDQIQGQVYEDLSLSFAQIAATMVGQ